MKQHPPGWEEPLPPDYEECLICDREATHHIRSDVDGDLIPACDKHFNDPKMTKRRWENSWGRYKPATKEMESKRCFFCGEPALGYMLITEEHVSKYGFYGDKIVIGGKRVCRFGKVVLSRKGFDSSAGGGYSPFDPQTGKYVVLPIPVDVSERDICNSLKYEDIRLQSTCLPRYSEKNLKSLMKAMGKKAKIKGEESEYAHFDPWLGHCPWLAGDSNHSIGAFGQVDKAQSHLDNQDVGEGSLFLFFSRFTPIGQNWENRIVPDISCEHLNEGLYFIYGWLKVKERIQKYENIHDPRLLSRHPHATKRYFEKHVNNTLYIADDFLFSDRSHFRGCGYFPRLNKDLCLSASDSAQEPRSWI